MLVSKQTTKPFSDSAARSNEVSQRGAAKKRLRESVLQQKSAIRSQQHPPMRRRFVSRSKFETLSARCCCNVIDGNDRNRFHHSRQLNRSVEPRRQGPCTKAIVARFRTIRSDRSLFPVCITTAMMLATANLSRSIAHVRTTRPTRRWTNQHGQAHQQVNETGEHAAVKGSWISRKNLVRLLQYWSIPVRSQCR